MAGSRCERRPWAISSPHELAGARDGPDPDVPRRGVRAQRAALRPAAARPADGVPRARAARPGPEGVRAGRRPHHPRHHPPAGRAWARACAVRRGRRLCAGDGARRHRRPLRAGGRSARPVRGRGADGAGGRVHRGARRRGRADRPGAALSAHAAPSSDRIWSRSTAWRTRATACSATAWPRCSQAGSTRWS